ncbi:HlyD family efflux transporter periplasmic adaptor subunit [Zeaxanthinibacter sp. PT1]|uniref:HlyD family secretion protein n=1 Tax=Zeaxanthinibacter TaxID=561554 RepID=UPI00234915FC|nr:HlyD family efflux transporter periplasmic adaptor subunit [Zeaxanthinibacter sp. PT1]MDC6351579.1 HlyD family efflux transporter periplasmic adaptor subunit [Zeaxanthinibacter sp. PT1]
MEILPDKRSVLLTVQGYSAHLSKRSNIVYNVLLFSISGFLIALPLIRVPVNRSVRGIVRGERLRIPVRVRESGEILWSLIEHNRYVEKGDTLLVQDYGLRKEIALDLENRLAESRLILSDLDNILSDLPESTANIITDDYRNALHTYRLKSQALFKQCQSLKQKLRRFSALFEKGVISDFEHQKHLREYREKYFEYEHFISQQKNIWRRERRILKDNINKLQIQGESIRAELKNLIIISPETGHLISPTAARPGTMLLKGNVLAELSPESEKLVECFVSSSLIGQIRENVPVRYSIDAYNSNLWGMASGRIVTIGKDVELVDSRPYYRVLCSLDSEFLQLKSGLKGEIKKGMSLTSHFLLAERSLYQLLFDKIDNWLDPNNF